MAAAAMNLDKHINAVLANVNGTFEGAALTVLALLAADPNATLPAVVVDRIIRATNLPGYGVGLTDDQRAELEADGITIPQYDNQLAANNHCWCVQFFGRYRYRFNANQDDHREFVQRFVLEGHVDKFMK